MKMKPDPISRRENRQVVLLAVRAIIELVHIFVEWL